MSNNNNNNRLTEENLAAHNQSLGVDTNNNEASSREESTSTPSTYNGSEPELLRQRAEALQDTVEDYVVENNNLEVAMRIANKADTGIPLSAEEQDQLDSVRNDMELNPDYSLSYNINSEILSNKERISELENKISEKYAKADALSVPSLPDTNPEATPEVPQQTTTEYVHELESCTPMDIVPFDD